MDGDRAAFDALVHRHIGPAWRLASAVAGSAPVAEAAVAGAFTNAFRQLEGGSAWMLTPFRALVVRAAIDDATAARAALPPASAPSAGARPRSHPLPDRDAMLTSFRALPGQWQAVLWLTIVEGGSTAEVGALLGVPSDVVAQLASRARAGLRQRYARAGGQASDAALLDLRRTLRVLVPPLPPELALAASARFAEWRATNQANRRRGVAAYVPFGAWAERVIAGAAAAVITAGLAAAIALGGDEATRAPNVAAPAGSGQLAGGQADPSGSGPTDGGGDAVPSSPPTVGPNTTRTTSGVPSPGAPAAAAASTGGLATNAPRGTVATPAAPKPAPAQDPLTPANGAGVNVGVNVGGTPIAVGVGGQTGVQVGPIVVGTPPATPATPGVQVITGVFPPILIPLL